MYYWPVLVALGIGAGLVFLVFGAAALVGQSAPVPYEQVTRPAYRIRFYWFCVLCAVLALGLAASLSKLPYPQHRLAALPASQPVQTVHVTGSQYTWSLSSSDISTNDPVSFQVTSADVNHGFGVYDPTGQLIGQTQAMPGYTNNLILSLDLPGDYTIRCLEYCGMGHSGMVMHIAVHGCSTATGC